MFRLTVWRGKFMIGAGQLGLILAAGVVFSGPAIAASDTISSDSAASLPQAARQESQPLASSLSAADKAVAQWLRNLIEHNIYQYIQREEDRPGLAAFYRRRGYAPLWIVNGAPSGRTKGALEFLKHVAADGLDPADYPTPYFADANPYRLAADELMLTNSVLTFAHHARGGRVDLTQVSGSIHFDLKLPDPSDVLTPIAEATDIRETLDLFNPQQPEYNALKAALASERGKQAAATPTRGQRQASTNRVDTILANMERWRWMPRDLGAAYVMVNIPDYSLKIVDHGKVVWSTRIAVGAPGKSSTPLLSRPMIFVTVNPNWNVRASAIGNEYLTALARDPAAPAQPHSNRRSNRDASVAGYRSAVSRGAAGHIRFDFPNRFLVYQRDASDPRVFAKSQPMHGQSAILVKEPERYAQELLSIAQPESGLTIESIRKLYGASERVIPLHKPIPVHLTYQTAFVDDAEQLQIRPDIYRYDSRIVSLLHGDLRLADIPREDYDAIPAEPEPKPAASPPPPPFNANTKGW